MVASGRQNDLLRRSRRANVADIAVKAHRLGAPCLARRRPQGAADRRPAIAGLEAHSRRRRPRGPRRANSCPASPASRAIHCPVLSVVQVGAVTGRQHAQPLRGAGRRRGEAHIHQITDAKCNRTARMVRRIMSGFHRLLAQVRHRVGMAVEALGRWRATRACLARPG